MQLVIFGGTSRLRPKGVLGDFPLTSCLRVAAWQSKGVACWYCVPPLRLRTAFRFGILTRRKKMLPRLLLLDRMGTARTFRAAMPALYALLPAVPGLFRLTPATHLAMVHTLLTAVFRIVPHTFPIQRAGIQAIPTPLRVCVTAAFFYIRRFRKDGNVRHVPVRKI